MLTKILRWPLGLAVTFLLILGLAAPSASAATLPVIQAYNVTGWSGMVTQPVHIAIGQGGSPYAQSSAGHAGQPQAARQRESWICGGVSRCAAARRMCIP